ncbi:hypothetical protein [Lysobacter enzymogenes]|uniref:hypothetical protein n=1 Tax=Lysobacter enzymogenes TaxID=69 RepID=UPI00099C51B4|nr:hypothetical protein [Lysobacter enzymogenes]UZW62744.1 hypothetical protein BV903_010815 [Lysobacter enzymogenes]
MPELPETEAFREFAARLGCKPGYITALKHSGRLALTEDGRRVRVAESLQLIASTRDPAKEGVRARHAVARGQGTASPVPSPSVSAGDDDDEAADLPLVPADPLSLRRAKAQAEREEALARKALREEQVEMGGLMVKDQVLSFVADAIVQLRSRLELLPVVLAPQLAATDDEDVVRVKLRDGIEQALDELTKKFSMVGRVEA